MVLVTRNPGDSGDPGDPAPPGADAGPPGVVRRVVAGGGSGIARFGMFWWDFLVGDTPELTVGGLVVLALALVLGARHRIAGMVVVPLAVLVVLSLSLARAVRASRRSRRG
ncbi:MAG: hypothetical protein M0Z93_11190 [Actinomycetota bacterium]|nr:hypothetical protein [Actinomycetota bacterium]